LCVNGANFFKNASEIIGNPLGNLPQYVRRIGNSLTNYSAGIGNHCKQYIFVRGLPIPSDLLPEGIG
jgi:hypothetical protein